MYTCGPQQRYLAAAPSQTYGGTGVVDLLNMVLRINVWVGLRVPMSILYVYIVSVSALQDKHGLWPAVYLGLWSLSLRSAACTFTRLRMKCCIASLLAQAFKKWLQRIGVFISTLAQFGGEQRHCTPARPRRRSPKILHFNSSCTHSAHVLSYHSLKTYLISFGH